MKCFFLISLLVLLFSCPSDSLHLGGDIDVLIQQKLDESERKKRQGENLGLVDYHSQVVGLLRYIPYGSYEQSHSSDHIAVEKPFRLAETEVTQEAWVQVMGDNPSWFILPYGPVNSISFFNAMRFCNKLSVREELEPVYYYKNLEEKITDLDLWIFGTLRFFQFTSMSSVLVTVCQLSTNIVGPI